MVLKSFQEGSMKFYEFLVNIINKCSSWIIEGVLRCQDYYEIFAQLQITDIYSQIHMDAYILIVNIYFSFLVNIYSNCCFENIVFSNVIFSITKG